MRLLAIAAAVLLWTGVAHAACVPGSVDQAGGAVKHARAALKVVHIEEMQEDIPAVARGRIEQLKDNLHAFVAATMACEPPNVDVKALGSRLSTKGDAFVPGHFQGDGYTMDHFDGDGEGRSLTYAVTAIASHPDMIGLTATLGLECGEDTMLMLYQQHGDGWREVLTRRSPPYKDVSGGWMTFRYAVSPSDRNGNWFAATSNIPPWCTSVWRSIRYDLSRPGKAPGRPDIFFRRSEGAYIGNDDVGELRAEASAFEILER